MKGWEVSEKERMRSGRKGKDKKWEKRKGWEVGEKERMRSERKGKDEK